MFDIKLHSNRPQKFLTQREEDVLLKIVQGKRNIDIAKELYISSSTVKVHVSSILHKFEVKKRSDVILIAIFNNWIEKIS